jgi:hypothetical protein
VQIRIGNMDNYGKNGLAENQKPFVEIEDDGDGMSFETIRDSWMNPASPDKYRRRLKRKIRTRKGRVIQGEKGIGRYAVFQIGKKVEMFTRQRLDEDKGGAEIKLVTDLTGYSEELLEHKQSKHDGEPVYLDQIESRYSISDEPQFIKPGSVNLEGKRLSKTNHGTLIRITELNYGWTAADAKKIRRILSGLQSPFRKKDFDVSIVFEGEHISAFEDFELQDVLDEALLKMSGEVDQNGICTYSLKRRKGKEEPGRLDLVDNLKHEAQKINRFYFFDEKYNRIHKPDCGPFRFEFYVYDLDTMSDTALKEYIRAHRAYIYRDSIRVYPYGDPDNDWLKIDMYRGLVRARFYLSNDQLIGYVDISSERNPGLRDKTNREGLLEQGTAYEDIRLLTLSALNFLNTEFQKEKLKPQVKAKHRKSRISKFYLQAEKVEKSISGLSKRLAESKDDDGKKLLNKLTEDY